MNKKNILIVLLSLTLCLGILTGCGTAGENASKSVSSSAPVSDGLPRSYTAEDLEGLISGLGDVAVLQGSEQVDLEKLVSWDTSVIQNVTLEAGALDFGTQSSVAVTWTVTADAAALAQHLGEEFQGETGETVTISQTSRVYVIAPGEASEFQTRHPEVPIYGDNNTPYDPAADESQEAQQQTGTDQTAQQEQPQPAESDDSSEGTGSQTGGSSTGSTGSQTGAGSTGSAGSQTGGNSTGNAGSGGGADDTAAQGTAQPSQPEHQHVWHDHIAQRWVENIVTVPDYETQKTPVGTNFIFSYDGYTTSDIEDAKAHAVELIYAGLPDNYRTETIYETQTVQVGSHQEDQGWYEDYVDYQYCDCGAVR